MRLHNARVRAIDNAVLSFSDQVCSCDSIDFLTGTEKPLSQCRNGLSHAQKERSAMTNLFGLLGDNGAMQWHQDRATGLMVGNPSISPLVSRYMLGLAKRKSLAGESSTSARAITPDIMRRLYRRNRRDYMDLEVSIPKRGTVVFFSYIVINQNERLEERLVQACYTLAFLCLLRFDEVLQLQVSDLEWICDSKGRRVVVQLPFRKTAHSLAKIQPMILWPLGPEEAHLCPYRALCEWIDASDIKDGYLFPKLSNDGRVKSTATPEHMTSEMFLEHFRNDLLDVGIKFTSYGTHSFRRGGCQYLLVHRRWNIRRICEWGGWSTDFTYMTIVKYIISYIDEPMSSREDFFRPGPHVNRLCNQCGRRCACNS
ncbi:DNA breaking-rejoining enzyme [Schizophyllum commune]